MGEKGGSALTHDPSESVQLGEMTKEKAVTDSDSQLSVGDLVRVSKSGLMASLELKDREGQFGAVSHITEKGLVTVDWLNGGNLSGLKQEDLVFSTAEEMEESSRSNGRRRKPPPSFMDEVTKIDEAKKKKRMENENRRLAAAREKAALKAKKAKKVAKASSKPAAKKGKASAAKKTANGKTNTVKKTASAKSKNSTQKKAPPSQKSASTKPAATKGKKRKLQEPTPASKQETAPVGKSLFEKHQGEFERFVTKTLQRSDIYGYFFDDAPPEFDETLPPQQTPQNQPPSVGTNNADSTVQLEQKESSNASKGDSGEKAVKTVISEDKNDMSSPSVTSATATDAQTPVLHVFPAHPPFNWKMLRHRIDLGRYELDREKAEEDDRHSKLGPFYDSVGKKFPRRRTSKGRINPRVLHPKGINWDLFRDDVLGMCDAAIARDNDPEARNSLASAANRIKEAMLKAYEKTGTRQMREMSLADDRHKFGAAIEKTKNTEAAMQSWRKEPFPERIYERLSEDAVCDGLSEVDGRIATYELRTNLPDSFVGISYRYDDTGQSEDWMKSVVDETGSNDKGKDEARQAALALAADDGVTRAQVVATMQTLLIGVQDKVMTEKRVLHQPELRSANWEENGDSRAQDSKSAAVESPNTSLVCNRVQEVAANELLPCGTSGDNPTSTDWNEKEAIETTYATKKSDEDNHQSPDIVEQPVWGMDCYTRRNIKICLRIEFDEATVLKFIEKWLLPAINACPVELAQDISSAARLLEGLPFVKILQHCADTASGSVTGVLESNINWSQTLMGEALRKKIKSSAPSWLKGAASELRRAHEALGPDFFRIHPKGHGSVLLSPSVPANRLVTFYRGELYPSWRWGEKMDAIEMTQERKDLKPNLPDFYNMALERPQTDPRGYGLLFVDASRKAGHGSSLSHSCDPTCEVRVAAKNGELCLAMTTLRELEMGEELTFDYHAVTESLNEYQSAVCLCGYAKCRGSFLHFATADCYQQVLNRNAPIATRFSNIVKRSMKQVMSEDDEKVLGNHGFHTAAFGAISVNRREDPTSSGNEMGLLDSTDIVPVWLKTYVADTLRYIEYERRALPISLICDHLSTVKTTAKKKTVPTNTETAKKPGREPAFFYYSRVERSFFRSILRQQGFPESANGRELKSALLRVASAHWKELGEEKKAYWKKRTEAEYKKKMAAWLAGQERDGKSQAGERKKQKKTAGKQSNLGIGDVLLSSKISFQDADAEGVQAMEQRIQQLTQALSRVGRVLDRHREETIEKQVDNEKVDHDVASLREIAHSPVRLLPDEEVVGWMWNSSGGLVLSMLRQLESAKCVRPVLLEKLNELRNSKYAFLEKFGDPTKARPRGESRPANGVEGRREMNKALLDMRKIIIDEMKEMAKEFRRYRSQIKAEKNGSEEVLDNNQSEDDETALTSEDIGQEPTVMAVEDRITDTENDLSSVSSKGREESCDLALQDSPNRAAFASDTPISDSINRESKIPEHVDREGPAGAKKDSPETATNSDEGRETASNATSLAVAADEKVATAVEVKESKPITMRERSTESDTNDPMGGAIAAAANEVRSALSKIITVQSHPWIEHYSHRFALHATADTLLFYARTTNFFSLRPYRVLESTPVDVYAREIGNCVPRSIVDEEVADNPPMSPQLTQVSHETSNQASEESESFPSNEKSHVGRHKGHEESKKDTIDDAICAPADIVARVSVRYQGDYVLSQLLQWYNGGIGQKPGLPDLSGCTILPSMEGIWSSSLLERNFKPEKKTLYESKIRSRLVEWLQDPYQRGNPWPSEIRQVFEQSADDLLRLEDSSSRFTLFGSPVTDFLIEGDESNISAILSELDADDKVASKKANGLLSSLDRGRPAQAVSTWVQCEECLKWRKIPWQVDVDLLPEKFYCKDNIWNTATASCEVPEDEWDMSDPLVDANGKVESSPIRRRKAGSVSPLDEKNFKVGVRFDVLREGKLSYCTGVVAKVDFCGKLKKVLFHFPKVDSRYDEWIEFGSERIARLYTKAPPPQPKATKTPAEKQAKKSEKLAKKKCKFVAKEAKNEGSKTESSGDKKTRKIIVGPSPSDEKNFTVGARFDIRRYDKDRFSVGKVVEIDFSTEAKRVLFHVPKSKDLHDEWIEFGSDRIAAFNTKSLLPVEKPPKKPRVKIEKGPEVFPSVSPREEKNFVKEARFDVLRSKRKEFCTAIVVDTDFSDFSSKRILFRFKNTPLKFNEWVDFGSDRIAAYNTRAPPPKPKKKKIPLEDRSFPQGEKPSKKTKFSDEAVSTASSLLVSPSTIKPPELAIDSALLEAVMMAEAVPTPAISAVKSSTAETTVVKTDQPSHFESDIHRNGTSFARSPLQRPSAAAFSQTSSGPISYAPAASFSRVGTGLPDIASPPRVESSIRSFLENRQQTPTNSSALSPQMPRPRDLGELVHNLQQQALVNSISSQLSGHAQLAHTLSGLNPVTQQSLLTDPPTSTFGFPPAPASSLPFLSNPSRNPSLAVPPQENQSNNLRPPSFTTSHAPPRNWNPPSAMDQNKPFS